LVVKAAGRSQPPPRRAEATETASDDDNSVSTGHRERYCFDGADGG
jgi:hypothetical protein